MGNLSKISKPQGNRIKKNHKNLKEKVADCVAEQFWGLYRHGTRYPSVIDYEALTGLDGVLEAIKLNFQEGRGELCYSDYKLLQTYGS